MNHKTIVVEQIAIETLDQTVQDWVYSFHSFCSLLYVFTLTYEATTYYFLLTTGDELLVAQMPETLQQLAFPVGVTDQDKLVTFQKLLTLFVMQKWGLKPTWKLLNNANNQQEGKTAKKGVSTKVTN